MIVVDRIEGERAVLSFGGELIDVPLAALPKELREGDVLAVSRDETARAGILTEGEARLERLRARSEKGPDTFDL